MDIGPDNQLTILIADDDPQLRNLLRIALQEDYDVLVAASGLEALHLSRRHRGVVDLLLTDVVMPGMEGPDLYQQLSAERPRLKVLFISGTRVELKGPAGEQLPFVQKPFDLHTLRARIRAVAAAPDTPKMVLLVDSNIPRRTRTSRILRDNGYAVLKVRNTIEAEALTDGKARIDVIIAEVKLDGTGSGVDVAEYADASKRGIDTLLISHFDPVLLRKVPGFSAQPEFLGNPFTAEELLKRVRALIYSRNEQQS